MFAAKDIEDVVARLQGHGAKLVGELGQTEESYRMGYVRAPEGTIVGLVEQSGDGQSDAPLHVQENDKGGKACKGTRSARF